MKKNFVLFLIYFNLIVIGFLIFKNWFSLSSLSSGDWVYKFPHAISVSPLYFYAWDANFYKGMGSNIIFLLPLSTYSQVIPALLFDLFKLPWTIIEKIVWYLPFLCISILGSFFFFKKIILKNNILALISSLIFTTNTYILLTVGGGQIGVGTAYALIPLVAYGFINILNKVKNKEKISASIIAGILFSIQLMLDSRIAYVSAILIVFYYIIFLLNKNFLNLIKSTFIYFSLIPGTVILFLNFFWFMPFVLIGKNPLSSLGAAYTDQNMVTYLSFAKFENTISLLHPNWPENIFGKIGFMKPEFILLPILAFIGLFFISKIKEQRTKSYILFFALLGLIGAFLAKGTSEPFGGIYLWMFNHIPGFVMFRDSTKWYGLVTMAYSVLIPFSIYLIVKRTEIKFKLFSQNVLVFIFLIVWIFLSRQAILGQLSGTFVTRQIPTNYINLADFLIHDNSFYRTLWVPNFTQFSYYSAINPIIPAGDFYSAYSEQKLINKIKTSGDEISMWSIKYIIVPDDIQGKIFVKDRKYDDSLYKKTVADLEKISFIKKKKTFGKITVFEVLNPKDHFYIQTENLKPKTEKITYKYVSPVEYMITVEDAKKGDRIVFSENYDAGWVIQSSKFKVQSSKFDNRFNSFVLPEDGNYNLRVYYTPQDYVNIGLIVSGFTLITTIGILLYLRKKKI